MLCLLTQEGRAGEVVPGVLLRISLLEIDAIVRIAIIAIEIVVRATVIDLAAAEAMTAEALAAIVAEAEAEAGAFPVTALRPPSHPARTIVAKARGATTIRMFLGLVRLPVLDRDRILVLGHRHRNLPWEMTRKKKVRRTMQLRRMVMGALTKIMLPSHWKLMRRKRQSRETKKTKADPNPNLLPNNRNRLKETTNK